MSYELYYDSYNRMAAQIAPGMTVGIKLFSETDPRRVEKGDHGFAVLDVETELGMMRTRNIRIKWNSARETFFLLWPGFPTGRDRSDGKREFLDITGPLDFGARQEIDGRILEVFHQIKGRPGSVGRANPQLEKLQEKLTEGAGEAQTEDQPAAEG